MPLFRDDKGKTLGCFGYLPSDFNEECGFDDSFISKIIFEENNKFKVDIELDSWETYRYATLRFYQVYKYIIRVIDRESNFVVNIAMDDEKLLNSQILAAREIPTIKYILREYQIEYDPLLVENRLFCILGTYDFESDWQVLIFCKSWDLELIK